MEVLEKKNMDMEDVLDGAIDVIHFCMLKLNKSNVNTECVDTEWLASNITDEIQSRGQLEDRMEVKCVMYLLSVDDNSLYTLGFVLQILDYYSFTAQDIIDQYKIKNAENFRKDGEWILIDQIQSQESDHQRYHIRLHCQKLELLWASAD